MALQVSLSRQSWPSSSPITSSDATRGSVASRRLEFTGNFKSSNGGVAGKLVRDRFKVRTAQISSSLEAVLAEPETLIGKVTEVNKDTFWPIVNAAGEKPVVLDMYTQWCGPCKVIAPKFKELAQKYADVVFLKLDCNEANKPLAKELGIKVVPTFKILKKGEIVTEVTGAKLEKLIEGIETVRTS